ncbi:hypothetical protein I4U23_010697 [Adineta vaga]|nr:hypothetical protein I4U23_010697 [Adineta vaga]
MAAAQGQPRIVYHIQPITVPLLQESAPSTYQQKTFIFNDRMWGIGVAETFSSNNILERKDELLVAVVDEKKESQLSGIIFSTININKTFHVEVKYGVADLGSEVSQKKDSIPQL